ncbi:MAG: hypothetical protein QXO37_09365 [Candidatus Nitrosocaldaceae archaeon]
MGVIVLALDGFDVNLLKLEEFGNTKDIYIKSITHPCWRVLYHI